MDWNAVYGTLAPDPNKVYGQILPFARRQVPEPDWPGQPAYMQPYQGQPHDRPYGSVSMDDYNLAMPTMVRDGLKGVVDLAHGTETGKLTPEALQSVTFGTLAPGMALAPRGALAMGAAKPALPPIRAYHGSPHSFDKFDISKIGTGEGAQAYGHGLYFAENEGVAKGYRDALGGDAMLLGGQKVVPTAGSPGDMALAHLRSVPSGSEPFSEARRSLRSLRDAPESNARTRDAVTAALKQLDEWQLAGGSPGAGGHMYEVAIHADPAKFLDWDKPMIGTQANELLRPHDWHVRGEHAVTPGRDIYGDALDRMGPEQATEFFKNAGIPGIKYLDQGSRAAGDGSRNYVVFDDNLIEILRKYGLGGPAPFSLAPARDDKPIPNAMLPYEQRVY